jgi:3-dehydroquinate synthetase
MQPAERQRAIALLDTLHLPARTEEVLPQRPADSELLPFVQRDKKRTGGVLRVVLPRGFGACEVTELAAERLVAGLD